MNPTGDFEPPLDEGIRRVVLVLREHGIETVESCQGGEGHSYSEPTVKFTGSYGAGMKALGVALEHGFPLWELRRVWSIIDGEPTGPHWDLVLSDTVPPE